MSDDWIISAFGLWLSKASLVWRNGFQIFHAPCLLSKPLGIQLSSPITSSSPLHLVEGDQEALYSLLHGPRGQPEGLASLLVASFAPSSDTRSH